VVGSPVSGDHLGSNCSESGSTSGEYNHSKADSGLGCGDANAMSAAIEFPRPLVL